MNKPDRLLDGEDEVFINEITKRCCSAPWGTVHAEVQYTALHFQFKTASIYEARIRELRIEVGSKAFEKGKIAKEAECEARIAQIWEEIEKNWEIDPLELWLALKSRLSEVKGVVDSSHIKR